MENAKKIYIYITGEILDAEEECNGGIHLYYTNDHKTVYDDTQCKVLECIDWENRWFYLFEHLLGNAINPIDFSKEIENKDALIANIVSFASSLCDSAIQQSKTKLR